MVCDGIVLLFLLLDLVNMDDGNAPDVNNGHILAFGIGFDAVFGCELEFVLFEFELFVFEDFSDGFLCLVFVFCFMKCSSKWKSIKCDNMSLLHIGHFMYDIVDILRFFDAGDCLLVELGFNFLFLSFEDVRGVLDLHLDCCLRHFCINESHPFCLEDIM
eukprot:820094_1